ncbi:MAG: MarR family transcriptional regulator [Defluviicoccus sp.]|nr:MarR family transcriptional regulator [Defluviicoccus sp.]
MKRVATARRDDAGPAYVLEDQVGHLLRRAHQRHAAIFQDMIGDAQLTPLQFAALVKLHDLGEVSQNELGRRTAMDAATMQGVIKRLLARGLIDRKPDAEDRRRVVLSLTGDGRSLIAAAMPDGHAISDETLAGLDEAERRAFLALLKRLT